MRYLLVLSALLTLVSGCSDSGRMQRMDVADALLEINPDSSLAVMKGIDVSSLRGKEEKARHSLLTAMSLVRTGNMPDNDSVLDDAWEYYGEMSEPSREAMLTHYAKAAMSANPSDEFEEYEKSISLAKGRGTDFYKGAALVNMAVEFSNNGNDFKAREYLDAAKPFIFNAGDSGKILHYITFPALSTPETENMIRLKKNSTQACDSPKRRKMKNIADGCRWVLPGLWKGRAGMPTLSESCVMRFMAGMRC